VSFVQILCCFNPAGPLHIFGGDSYAVRVLVLTKTIDRHGLTLYVGITDYDWFKLHTSKESVDEVNFRQPSSTANFKALQWGEPFLFKLHSPRNFIVGGGFFTKFLQLPVSLAWDAFGDANGATSLEGVRTRIAKYRKHSIGPAEDPQIGCILLEERFFFAERDWIPSPKDFKAPTQVGKSYGMDSGTGQMLWREVRARRVSFEILPRNLREALLLANQPRNRP
jgi:putative restriction endonuclease